jgi:hypothetical protein
MLVGARDIVGPMRRGPRQLSVHLCSPVNHVLLTAGRAKLRSCSRTKRWCHTPRVLVAHPVHRPRHSWATWTKPLGHYRARPQPLLARAGQDSFDAVELGRQPVSACGRRISSTDSNLFKLPKFIFI